MHPLGAEVLARGDGVLGRHGQARAALQRTLIVEARFRRDHHAAAADAEIDRLVQALAAVLEQDVLAGNAQVRGAMLHVGGHIGRANNDKSDIAPIAAG